MIPKSSEPSSRIEIIDALRGSALLGILLVHSVEHFDFMRYPRNPPAWLQTLNFQARDAAFFLFGGKAYAIFALMFGLSFFLILDRAARRGVNFRWRFLWRLAVLAIIGFLHSLVYCGDILGILAILGIPLVFLYSASDRMLGWLSALLVLQLPTLWQLGRIVFESGYAPAGSHYGPYYRELSQVFANQGLLDVLKVNVWHGALARGWWTIDTGRYLQMMGLFVWGLMLGRSRVFENPEAYACLAKKVLWFGIAGFAVLYPLKLTLGTWGLTGMRLRVSDGLLASYGDLAQMFIWAGGFVLLYHFTRVRGTLRLLIPYGRMSLTCYVTQALVGVPLFYNFGFGLYRQLGQFYSVLGGALFFVLQCALAHLWLKRFQYGPLEWLWRCATLLSFDTPFRKRATAI